MKKITALLMTIVLAFGLTACGSTVGDISLEAGQSAIYIEDDGTVSYAVSETFEKDYYDKGDLKDKIENEVDAYNNSSDASVNGAVSLKDFKVKSDVATMVLELATEYDFLTYMQNYNKINNDKFYIGKIEDNSDCKVKGDFVSPDGKEVTVGKEIKKMSDANILIVNEAYKVQVDGTIKYVSDNCTIGDDGIVSTAKAEDGTSYIVYTNK